MKFVNGSSIEPLPFVGGVNRGNRYNIIGCECYDKETGEIVVAEIDIRKIERYIPLFLVDLSQIETDTREFDDVLSEG